MNTTLSYYKNLIKKHFIAFFITFFIVFSLFVFYSYVAQKVYMSEGTVEVIRYKQNQVRGENQLQITIKESSPVDEAEIIKSNFLINNSIKELDFNYEFFENINNKIVAVNKVDLPFQISLLEFKNKNIYNKNINLEIIDKNSYRLFIDTSAILPMMNNKFVIKINEVYKFGQLVENELFTIRIDKKGDL